MARPSPNFYITELLDRDKREDLLTINDSLESSYRQSRSNTIPTYMLQAECYSLVYLQRVVNTH